MAELDYAFVARWAGINAQGTLTAVEIGFLQVEPGDKFTFSVAGRVRFAAEEAPASARIEIEPQRMRRRRVRLEEIQEVLDDPEGVVFDANEVSHRLEKVLSRGTLRVWVPIAWPPAGDEVTIKTVAWKGRDG